MFYLLQKEKDTKTIYAECHSTNGKCWINLLISELWKADNKTRYEINCREGKKKNTEIPNGANFIFRQLNATMLPSGSSLFP